MSKPFNPFQPFGEIDFSKFDVSKLLGDYKLPGVDVDALMASQKRNIEALTSANQAALQGLQAVAQRQAEILTQTMAESQAALQQLSTLKDPKQLTGKQAELVQAALEKALTNMREVAEMVTKANTETFEIVNKRVNEGLAEVKTLLAKK